MKCLNCNFENPEEAKFCKNCGQPMQVASAPPLGKTERMKNAVRSVLSETTEPIEDRYDNLKSISKFYKVITALVGLGGLFLAYKVGTHLESWETGFLVLVLFLPITILLGAQSDKIEILISQEKSMRECSYYLKQIFTYLGEK